MLKPLGNSEGAARKFQIERGNRAMPYKEILYEVTDRGASITLNRPAKPNAWTMTMEKEVQAAMEQAEKDDNVRVIILTGAGRSFCAGMDMQALDQLAGGVSGTALVERIRAE